MNTSVRRFKDYVEVCLEDEANLIRRLLIKVSPTEMYVQEQSLSYLNLALPSPTHHHWKRYITNVVNRRLPHFCKEFFIAEKIPKKQEVSWVCNHLVYHYHEYILAFRNRVESFMETVVLAYETRLFHGISNKDSESKKRIIREYLRFYRIAKIDRFDVNFPFLLDLCLNPPLDCDLTIELLRTFCDYDQRKLSIMKIVGGAKMLEDLILHAKEARFDFWGLWNTVPSATTTFDYVSHFLARDFDQELVIILLKHGFPYSAKDIEYRKRYYELRRMAMNDRILLPLPFRAINCSTGRHTRMMLIMDIFLIYANEAASFKIPTLRYLFRSQPLLYVTPQELKDTMLRAVPPNYRWRLEDVVKRYTESNDFDDDIKISMPRRCMHLCRVAVRNVFLDNFVPLDDIEKLNIPDPLKAYLKLEI